jgi:hypothetical protein
MGMAGAVIARGIPEAVQRITEAWYSQALTVILPEWHDWFEAGATVVAYIFIIIGWILLSYTTIFLLNLIF